MATSHEQTTTFDHHSLEFGADPFTICEHLRNRHPVSWSDAHNGYWILANHELVADAFRDYETVSSASGATIPDLSLGNWHIPTTVDPPDHVAYRQFLTPKFSKVAIKPYEGSIRTIVRELIGDAAAKGSWDFVKDLAEVVPGTVMLTLLGMAPERRREFSERMQRGIDHAGTADPAILAQIEEDRQWLVAQATEEIELRRQQPRDDLFRYLVNGDFLDRKLRQDEIMEIAVNLFVAGFHTTSAAFSSAIMHFDAFPEHRKAIIHNPELLPKAIEEINRVYSPVTAMARTLKQDITMNGITLKSGEKALLSIMAANRDPKAFPHPDVVDVTDDAKNSLAWGWVIHRCLGIHLARMVLRIELETVLELMPDYMIDREHVRLVPDVGISYLYATIPASIPGDGA